MISPSKIGLALLCCLLVLGTATLQVREAHAQPGTLLARFATPARSADHFYFPTGMAFDGTNLWYTDPSDTSPDIFKTTTQGTLLRTLPIVLEVGALAWDGTILWVSTFDAKGQSPLGALRQVSVGQTPAVLQKIELNDILVQDDECGIIDGLDFDSSTNTIWFSPDPGCAPHGNTADGFVYHIDLNGNLLSKIEFPFGVSGVGKVGNNLYVVKRTPFPLLIEKTTLTGQIVSSFPTATLVSGRTTIAEDLAFDPVSFASQGKCALWANERAGSFFSPTLALTAYEIDCP